MQNGGAGRGQGNDPPNGGQPLPSGHYDERNDLRKALYFEALKDAGVGPKYQLCLTCLENKNSKH
jgi:hypothetical protein